MDEQKQNKEKGIPRAHERGKKRPRAEEKRQGGRKGPPDTEKPQKKAEIKKH